MSTRRPVETKVHAATTGGGAGGIVSAAIVWALGAFLWGGPNDAANASKALAAVPAPITALVLLTVPAVGAFIGGYYAHHTPKETAMRNENGYGLIELVIAVLVILILVFLLLRLAG